jgi:hypothetical protein
MDIVQMAMKVEGPNTITAQGEKFFLKDSSDIPDTLQITWEYPGFVAVYENRLCNGNSLIEHPYGIVFHGTDGTLFVDREGFQVYPEMASEGDYRELRRSSNEEKARPKGKTPEMKMVCVEDGLSAHVQNMLDCMRSRKLPTTDIETGHRSTTACLLGNVALRSKERLEWDVASQKLKKGGPIAQKLLAREYRSPWRLEV